MYIFHCDHRPRTRKSAQNFSNITHTSFESARDNDRYTELPMMPITMQLAEKIM